MGLLAAPWLRTPLLLTSWRACASWRSAGCAGTWGPCCSSGEPVGLQSTSAAVGPGGRGGGCPKSGAPALRQWCGATADDGCAHSTFATSTALSPLAAGVALALRLLDAVPAGQRSTGRAAEMSSLPSDRRQQAGCISRKLASTHLALHPVDPSMGRLQPRQSKATLIRNGQPAAAAAAARHLRSGQHAFAHLCALALSLCAL